MPEIVKSVEAIAQIYSKYLLLLIIVICVVLAIIIVKRNPTNPARAAGRMGNALVSAGGVLVSLNVFFPYLIQALHGGGKDAPPNLPPCLENITGGCHTQLTVYLEKIAAHTVPADDVSTLAVLVAVIAAVIWFRAALKEALGP